MFSISALKELAEELKNAQAALDQGQEGAVCVPQSMHSETDDALPLPSFVTWDHLFYLS